MPSPELDPAVSTLTPASTEAPVPPPEARTSGLQAAERPGPVARLVNVWRYRELLGNLTRKELKVKYKNSVLGFVWSLLNPALYLVVFSIVFGVILKSGIPKFAIFMLAGLLPWNLFSTAVGSSTGAITGNAGLVGKVWFPREILPLASIGAALVHFFLQLLVLGGALIIFRYAPSVRFMTLLIPALIVLLVLCAALSIALAAINVYMRDTEHFVELAMLAWFWGTPIVYQYQLVNARIGSLVMLNPLTPIVITFQRAIYNRTHIIVNGTSSVVIPDGSVLWYMRNLALVLAASVALLVFALWLFGRLEDNFAEEI